jgi:hypothetical protein
MALGSNIQIQLNMYRNERQNGSDYIGWISKSFEDLQESSPLLKTEVLKSYAEISAESGIIVPEAANMVAPMKFGLKRKKRIQAPSKISVDGSIGGGILSGRSDTKSERRSRPPLVRMESSLRRSPEFDNLSGSHGSVGSHVHHGHTYSKSNVQLSTTTRKAIEKFHDSIKPTKVVISTPTPPPKPQHHPKFPEPIEKDLEAGGDANSITKSEPSSGRAKKFDDRRMHYEWNRLKKHEPETV